MIFYDLDLPEVIEIWLKKPLKRIVNYKMQHRGDLGKDATYNFGVRDSKEMEEWHTGNQFLGDWSYFDSEERNLDGSRCLGILNYLEKLNGRFTIN